MTDAEIVAAEIRAAEVPMSDALGAALDRLERDAERYRGLRGNEMTTETVRLDALVSLHMTESNEQGQPLGLASTAGLGLVERLRQERRPTRWARGVDTDYPHSLCQEAADALERLIEDRARFPDRPDDIGAMIGAHFSNLRARADTNEEAWRRTQLRSDVEVARLRAALEQIVRDCTARKAVMIARKALEA